MLRVIEMLGLVRHDDDSCSKQVLSRLLRLLNQYDPVKPDRVGADTSVLRVAGLAHPAAVVRTRVLARASPN